MEPTLIDARDELEAAMNEVLRLDGLPDATPEERAAANQQLVASRATLRRVLRVNGVTCVQDISDMGLLFWADEEIAL